MSMVKDLMKSGKFATYKWYVMVKRAKIEVFKAKMGELGSDEKDVVISVLKNFICDAEKGVADEATANGLCRKNLKAFIKSLNDTLDRLPESRFALTEPIVRPGKTWYAERHRDLCKFFAEGVKSQGRTNMVKLDSLTRMPQKFD
jgi:hypothetical protein